MWLHWLEELSRDHTLIGSDVTWAQGYLDWDVEDVSFEAWVRDLEAVMDATVRKRAPLFANVCKPAPWP